MTLWNRIRNRIALTATRLAAIVAGPLPAARATEDAGWVGTRAGAGPNDRYWHERYEDLTDTLEAWRRNFIIRRTVVITSSYVVGKTGVSLSAKKATIERWLQRFVGHPQNRLRSRQVEWCDEITRSGELFIALTAPDPSTGLSYLRALPASCIEYIETDPGDYERPIAFHQTIPGRIEPKIWKSKYTAKPDEPVLLHYPYNRIVGATRGESDLTPLLPVAQRYTSWMKAVVRRADIRNKLAAAEIIVDDESQIAAKQQQYTSTPPTDAEIYVHGRGEELKFPAANLTAYDNAPDGQIQRIAISSASNFPVHFFGEGSSATRSTAKEMGGPTHSFLEMRQTDFGEMLIDIAGCAYRRAAMLGLARLPADDDLAMEHNAPDVSESDNLALAQAAKEIVTAFGQMRSYGWITDPIAVRLAFRFFGEILTEEEIEDILDWNEEQDHALPNDPQSEDEPDGSAGSPQDDESGDNEDDDELAAVAVNGSARY